MPFLFSHVCDLLQRLEDNQAGALSRSRSGPLRTSADIIREWFAAHRAQINRDDHNATALLSTLLPEKRSDRVYCLRERRLCAAIGRGLVLGRTRIHQLGRWNQPGSDVDLAECVESILKETPNPVFEGVTVEEIDGLLHNIAAATRFSSPAVRRSGSGLQLTDRERELGDLYKRVSARDAKWLTRLILKNFEPVVLDPMLVYRSYHPFLPAIIRVQDDLTVAGRILANIRRDRTVTEQSTLAEYLKPALGVKIGRQPWFKGRSIKHCLDMGHGRMSCEEKIDGEYCQIHIDPSKGRDCIQIFSKSGKDSTKDRIALHDSIRQSLRLGQSSCAFTKGCILEGELVVYSDKESKILDFHKIRKHVSRSGCFLGTDQDSQRHPWEHLMIVYYDLLMVDDESLLSVRQSERFKRLKELVALIPGRSTIVKREIIDCDRRSAASDLRRAFAKCIVSREEGLVLKPDNPYFDFDTTRRPYSCCAIKLKKEYIGNFGDIGDFAVVGARFEAAKARTYGIPNLKWTHYYVGCLENKDEVKRFGRRPKFVVTNVVELNATQHQMLISHVNLESVPWEKNESTILEVKPGIDNGNRPAVVFKDPPVFDLRCFSFDKAGNTGFWSPRFPMVNKIHCDRTYLDTITFGELQEMAALEKELPPQEDSQELLGWIAALENADPRSAAAVTASQSTVLSTEAPSSQSVQSSVAEQLTVVPGPPLGAESHPGPPVTSPLPSPSKFSGPPTPPKSSHARKDTVRENPAGQGRSPQGRKRSIDGVSSNSPRRSKARRCSAEQAESSASPQPISESPSTLSQREPLADVRESSSRLNYDRFFRPRLPGVASMYLPMVEKEDIPVSSSLPASMSFQETIPRPLPRISATQPTARTRRQTDNGSSNTLPFNNTATGTPVGCCRYLADSCSLSKFTFLLSPCISGFLWVTEDLLASHGISNFARDPKEWSSVDPLNGEKERGENIRCKKRRVVLVDREKRPEATMSFLDRIQEAGLKRRDGEREYVPVFDWRVLEELKTEEEKCARKGEGPSSKLKMKDHAGSVWRQFWVGLA